MKDTTCCPTLQTLLTPKLFKALGDPNRLAILASLASTCGARTVSDVATCCPVDLSVVSRHLATLRNAGIVAAKKRGKQVHYTLRARALASTLRRIADELEACCPAERGDER